MGKKPNPNRAAAQQKAAELRAAAARKERQKKQMTIAATLVAILVIGVAVTFAVLGSKGKTPDPSATGGVSNVSDIVGKVAAIPASSYDAVTLDRGKVGEIKKLEGGAEVKENGKPRVVYVGAEYCPFCAVERWSLVAALQRFGTFEGLGVGTSPAEPNIGTVGTLDFKDAKYTSEYLAFTGWETKDARGKELQKLSSEDEALFAKYNAPPFVEAKYAGSIPFVLYGGTQASYGASYDLKLVEGKTAGEIAAALQDPNSPIAQAVLASANVKTALLCQQTGNKPEAVCTSPGVMKAASAAPAK